MTPIDAHLSSIGWGCMFDLIATRKRVCYNPENSGLCDIAAMGATKRKYPTMLTVVAAAMAAVAANTMEMPITRSRTALQKVKELQSTHSKGGNPKGVMGLMRKAG